MLIRRGVPLCVCVALVAGGACAWRSQPKVQPVPELSIPELRVRAAGAEAAVRGASNRIDLAGRAIENAVAVRGEAEAAFLAALSARDASGLELLAKRVEFSHSDTADAFRLATRLANSCQRLSGYSAMLRAAVREVGEDTQVQDVSKDSRERLYRVVLDVDAAVKDVNAIADEIKVRWMVVGTGAPVATSQPVPVVERDFSVRNAQ